MRKQGYDKTEAGTLEAERMAAMNKVLFQTKDTDPMQSWVAQREAKLKAQQERLAALKKEKEGCAEPVGGR